MENVKLHGAAVVEFNHEINGEKLTIKADTKTGVILATKADGTNASAVVADNYDKIKITAGRVFDFAAWHYYQNKGQ